MLNDGQKLEWSVATGGDEDYKCRLHTYHFATILKLTNRGVNRFGTANTSFAKSLMGI